MQSLYDRYDFFDPIDYVPVSIRDKMVGSHSTGEASQHKLIGIADAYDAALGMCVCLFVKRELTFNRGVTKAGSVSFGEAAGD